MQSYSETNNLRILKQTISIYAKAIIPTVLYTLFIVSAVVRALNSLSYFECFSMSEVKKIR